VNSGVHFVLVEEGLIGWLLFVVPDSHFCTNYCEVTTSSKVVNILIIRAKRDIHYTINRKRVSTASLMDVQK
jgi:hypothetical protein